MNTIEITNRIEITNENISDLLETAFYGAITYWCDKIEIVNPEKYVNLYASDILPLNGTLILFDFAINKKHKLTLDMFLNGLKMEMENYSYNNIEDLMEGHDADTADRIIQYAIFNEIVYC